MVRMDKRFKIMYNIGKVKYLVNFHDGVKFHNDESPFYDIALFKNKKDLGKFTKELINKGFKEE